MVENKKIYIIVCEGPSEYAFLQELNRFLNESLIPVSFYPKIAGDGHYSTVIKKYKEVRRQNKKANIDIWVDEDTYKRNDCSDGERYNAKPANVPDFLFNKYNFEDVLTLFLCDEKLIKWQEICEEKNHFIQPMTAEIYEGLFRNNIIAGYRKGDFPFEELNANMLQVAFKNNKDENIKFYSAFIEKIENLIIDYL